MKFHQLFKASLYEPKKLAAFRLLPIGKVFSYVFIFVALFTALSFIRYLAGNEILFEASPEQLKHGETIGGLVYPMAFLLQLVISTSYIFLRVSIFGFIGIIVLKLMKRRGEYRHIWRTSAIAITLPILITIGLDFLPALKTFSSVITSTIHLAYIAAAAKYYPKITR